MSVNITEAIRLAKICIPKILSTASSSVSVSELSENNVQVKSLCRLWAGMGYIYQIKVQLPDNDISFIVKRVIPPCKSSRSMGDERKAASYLIEAKFYKHIASTLIEQYDLSIPIPYHVECNDNTDEVTICMSLLQGSSGYCGDNDSIQAVLSWLSTLHAATWGNKADEYVNQKLVQPIGSYWHLDTRPNEHDAISNRGWEGRLKLAARAIDERLKRDNMQCCIHGDAKEANMLFDGKGGVSMYDLQYCGRAPPSVDLAYFLCVAVGDTNKEYIQYYHRQLLSKLNKNDYQPTLQELEESVELALCDWQRFMSGWGQWGSDISSIVREVLDRLDCGSILKSEDAYREAMLREYG